MPIIKSAKKRVRVTAKKEESNKSVNGAYLNAIKRVEKNAQTASKEELEVLVKKAYTALDKAYNKGLIKANAVARQKSRLTKMLNAKA